MEQSINLITWHINEAKRILDPERGATTNSDAKRILAWLPKRKLDKVALRYTQQHGPVQVREKTKLAKAIELLIENNQVQKVKLDGTITLLVNPKSLSA